MDVRELCCQSESYVIIVASVWDVISHDIDKTGWSCVGRLKSTSSNDTVSMFWAESSLSSVLLLRDVFEKTSDRREVRILRNRIGRTVNSAEVRHAWACIASGLLLQHFLILVWGIKFCLCIEFAYEFDENEWKLYVRMSIEYWTARLFSMIIFLYF